MKIAKILVLLLICTLLVATLSACKVEGYTSTTTTDADGNETTETTTYSSEDGTNTTTETTEAGDGDEAEGEDSAIPAPVQGFADNFDALSGSDGTRVTNIEAQGEGNYKIHLSDPAMYFSLIMTGDELTAGGVTIASTDDETIRGCFGFFVKTLAADDVAEVVEGVMGASDGTYETDFARYGVQTENDADTPFTTLSMARK